MPIIDITLVQREEACPGDKNWAGSSGRSQGVLIYCKHVQYERLKYR